MLANLFSWKSWIVPVTLPINQATLLDSPSPGNKYFDNKWIEIDFAKPENIST